jgi:phenylacetate-coenzyme A ligase PaaK-like adenylate-forming protein
LRALRDHAYARSSFYARLHRGLELRPLHELPIVTKADVMDHFDELVTDPRTHLADVRAHLETITGDELFLHRYRVVATAGTTGRPGLFLTDEREWATVIASYARANDWAGLNAGLTHRMKLAVVSTRTPWHQSARVGATLASPLVPTLRLEANEPPAKIVAQLNAFQPESLVGYASILARLADEQLDGRLRISPRAVMSASEVLSDEMRDRIARAWGSSPFNVYAATETAGIASECEHHRLHLYEDLVIAEVVDEVCRPVPPRTYGARLLVTVLFNRTQPLIRYEMSDRIALDSGTCPCGRPFGLVAGVEGRREDVVSLPRRGGGTIALHPVVLHRALDRAPVRAWQVTARDGTVNVDVEPAEGLDDDALETEVRRALEEAGAVADVHLTRVEKVAQTPLGKAPHVRRA